MIEVGLGNCFGFEEVLVMCEVQFGEFEVGFGLGELSVQFGVVDFEQYLVFGDVLIFVEKNFVYLIGDFGVKCSGFVGGE